MTKHLSINASEVPRVYRFVVIVDGEPYGDVTQLLLDAEVADRRRRVFLAVKDATNSSDIKMEVFPA